MEISCVTSKGQLVIPAKLRQRYGIKQGTKVCFIERENDILLQPVTKEYIRSVCGLLKSKTLITEELLEERAKDKKREEAKLEKLGT